VRKVQKVITVVLAPLENQEFPDQQGRKVKQSPDRKDHKALPAAQVKEVERANQAYREEKVQKELRDRLENKVLMEAEDPKETWVSQEMTETKVQQVSEVLLVIKALQEMMDVKV